MKKCDGDHGGPRCDDPNCWNDDKLAVLTQIASQATQGPWEIDWYICRANAEDCRGQRKFKPGDELWRVPKSIGPISADENHWAGDHISIDPPDIKFLSTITPEETLKMLKLLSAVKASFLCTLPSKKLDAWSAIQDMFEEWGTY